MPTPGTPQRNFVPPSQHSGPFLFHTPAPSTPFHNQWTPGPKAPAFPNPQTADGDELADVSMTDASPATTRVQVPESSPQKKGSLEVKADTGIDYEQDENESTRPVSTGALRRVYSRRQRDHAQATTRRRRPQKEREDSENEDEPSDEESHLTSGLVKRLNVYFNPHAPMGPPGAPPVAQDLPQLLVGYARSYFDMS
jgi:hypothetical protein